jgi:PAT family beta-lactamase induction signal transducer AmpG
VADENPSSTAPIAINSKLSILACGLTVDISQIETIMANIGAVLLGFSSATQDIVIDAYRIESSDKNMQSMLSATYIAGYRIGMLVAENLR